MAVVEGTNSPEPPQNVRQVATEHAAVGVQLVDDDVLEVGKQLDPSGVMGQHAGVQHVWIRDDDVACLANCLSGADRCVAVVGVGLEIDLQLANEPMQLGELVLCQGLGRKEIERSGLAILEQRLQDRQVVADGLS